MRGLRVAVAAVALLAGAGCAPNNQDSPATATTTAPERQVTTETASRPDDVSLVLASSEGVDVVAGDGTLTRLWRRPVAAAYGLRANLVVWQGSDGAGDVYPPRPGGPVVLWSEGSVRELPMSPRASSVRLLDAGLLDDRPVVLVAEWFNEGLPEVAEALVVIDLDDLSRLTVVPRQPAWESGHHAASLRLDGDIIALYQSGVQESLVRWSSGKRLWSVQVARDRNISLVASEASVAVVESSFDRRRGFAPVLAVTRHDPATGKPRDPTVIDVVDKKGVIDAGVFCREWLTESQLACARSGGTPIAVSLNGSFYELSGSDGAIPSVVRGP